MVENISKYWLIILLWPVKMRTRAMAAAEEGGGEKRRRKVVGDGELRSPLPTLLQIATCSTVGSPEEELQFTDLEEIDETGAVAKKPRSDRFKAGSGENETVTATPPATVISSRRTVPAEKTPPATELEEFFASAETELHKRFIEKYNYDIVNDTPLEGRFQWIQVNP